MTLQIQPERERRSVTLFRDMLHVSRTVGEDGYRITQASYTPPLGGYSAEDLRLAVLDLTALLQSFGEAPLVRRKIE